MRVKSREEAVARYGPIDFASKHWPRQNEWIKMFDIMGDRFPNWKVLDTNLPVKHIALNFDLFMPFGAALLSVEKKGLSRLLQTFDGCFNIRMVRGSVDHFSAHSYGLAIDLNAKWNALGSDRGGFYEHPDFVKCFTDEGFSWGGNFHGRKDPMHFVYAWE